MIRRRFLNKPGKQTVAAVYVSLRAEDATLIISDCSRTVSLDLALYDAEDRANSLYKVGVLVEVLTDLHAALKEHCKNVPPTS